ncbi:unnamed protein product [Urochloa humidicola]
MDPEVAGGVAWARGGGNRAAEREQVLRDGRRLAAEREHERMSGPLILLTAMLMVVLALLSTDPPAWVSRARETGEQMLRARLYGLLNISTFAAGAALVGVLCAHRMQMRAAPSAERALAAAWALCWAVGALFLAFTAVARSENWGQTAAACCINFASAAIASFYPLLDRVAAEVFVWIGEKLFGASFVSFTERLMEPLRLRLERSMVDGC